MGVYRSVEMDLACERCGRVHRTDIQFKTGEDRCQVYTIGEHVADLPVDEPWGGIAERWCRSCREDHWAERERAMATVVAAQVQTGQLAVKLARAKAALTADQITARGAERADAARRASTVYGSTLVLADLYFLDHDDVWLATTRLYPSRWPALYQALNHELRRLGWLAGDDSFREDLSVYLDEERRIQVRLT